MESKKYSIDERIYREQMEMQMKRMDLWIQWGEERRGQIEKVALHI